MKSLGRIRHVWLGSAIVALSLCGGFAIHSQSGSPAPVKSFAAAPTLVLSESGPKTIVLEKDFGLLRPNEEVTGTFELKNTADTVWTLKQIQNSCSCTTASISKKRLQPGETSEIAVVYHAGGSTQDAVKHLRVDFTEADAPVALLTIKAKIRKPLSASVADLQVRTSGDQQAGKGAFEVFNYTTAPWPTPRVTPSVDWLTAEVSKIDSEPGTVTNGEPLEGWRVDVAADMQRREYGRHRGDLRVEAGDASENVITLPVTVDVVRPLNAVPESLFLGSVPAGKTVQKSVRLIATAGAKPIRLDNLQVSSESKLVSNLELEDVATRTFRLQAVFTPEKAGLTEGTISIRLRGQTKDLVTIRFQANVIAGELSP